MSAKKFISVILVLIAFCLVFNVAKAVTAEELLKEIARLQALIAQLQKQLAELQGKPAAWCHDFNVNLKIGDSGLEVEALQTALEKEGFDVSKDPKGYFGEYTASAVVGFQEKYKDEILTPWGLTHGTGFVGKTTRAKLNKLYGCGIVFPPPIKPSITVISPNGGEKWVKGEKHLVKLSNPPVECKEESSNCEVYSIELIDENSRVVGMISCGASIPKEAASMEPKEIEWDTHSVLACCGAGCLPIEVQPGKYKVRIASRYFSWKLIDESDNYFSIVTSTPWIKVISPNGGERWEIGKTYNIKWESAGVGKVYITLFNYDQQDSCRLTYESIVNTGSYSFVPGQQGRCPQSIFIGNRMKIEVSADVNTTNGIEVKDDSDNYFSIVSP
jgi:hypothetical protein